MYFDDLDLGNTSSGAPFASTGSDGGVSGVSEKTIKARGWGISDKSPIQISKIGKTIIFYHDVPNSTWVWRFQTSAQIMLLLFLFLASVILALA